MTKNIQNQIVKTINQLVEHHRQKGLCQHLTEDESLNGRTLSLDGKQYLNFGSCSYLGLEHHPDLIAGVMQAVQKYGSQFSSSRAYVSLGLYQELETLLSNIFARPVIVAASTSLGHMAVLPTVIHDNDVIIVDHQVHASVQTAVQLLKARGVAVHILQHSAMDDLEQKIKELKCAHHRIWYMADGVYSMHGDFAPIHRLKALMDAHKQFYLYIDDAHGMSWTGANGVGYVRSQIEHHPQMVLAVSLNKAFASAGGAIVFPNQEMERLVRNCGSTLIFSGPIQPPMLGAAIASAKLHLSDELTYRQQQLADLIQHTNQRLAELSLPQVEVTDGPLFFIPVGLPKITSNLVQRMFNDGFYINTAGFPAVPMKKGGLRFTLNPHLKKADIDRMIERLAVHYPIVLAEMSLTEQTVANTFNIPEFKLTQATPTQPEPVGDDKLQVHRTRTIEQIDAAEWDQFFAGRGNVTHSCLQLLERTFTQQSQLENQWDFFYVIVRDANQKIVLATFYTCALTKDDMFSSAAVSQHVEKLRQENPYYLASKAVMLGSLMSSGEQIYLDRSHAQWKDALGLLVKELQQTVKDKNAAQILLQGFPTGEDEDLKDTLLDLGFSEYRLPDVCLVKDLSWQDHQEYVQRLGRKYRNNFRREILDYAAEFEVVTEPDMSAIEIKHCYELYCNVHDRAAELNVYRLPFAFFEQICQHPDYDIMRLYRKEDPEARAEEKPLGVMYSFVKNGLYSALIVGLDYDYLTSPSPYKQMLYQTVQRAWELNCQCLDLTYTAVLEKKKVGARPYPSYAYVQSMDHYNQAVLQTIAGLSKSA